MATVCVALCIKCMPSCSLPSLSAACPFTRMHPCASWSLPPSAAATAAATAAAAFLGQPEPGAARPLHCRATKALDSAARVSRAACARSFNEKSRSSSGGQLLKHQQSGRNEKQSTSVNLGTPHMSITSLKLVHPPASNTRTRTASLLVRCTCSHKRKYGQDSAVQQFACCWCKERTSAGQQSVKKEEGRNSAEAGWLTGGCRSIRANARSGVLALSR